MALNKKGVFFTFVAIVFLSLLIFSYSIKKGYEMREESFVIESKIDSLNRFVYDVEDDISRGAYIVGFRALIALEDKVVLTGEYVSDLDSAFNELFFNGTLDGNQSTIMQNNTFFDWKENIINASGNMDITLNFTVNSLNLSQDNPWTVKVDLDIKMDIIDKKNICSWNKDMIITSQIDIEGFEDPFYRVETNGVADNIIERTTHDDFVNGADVSNLMNHTYSGYYIEFSDAPSYLMRLQGDFGSSEYGIESLIDIAELVGKGVTVRDRSIVDYVYFGIGNPKKYSVLGTPGWFKLDEKQNMYSNQTHLELYEVTGLV